MQAILIGISGVTCGGKTTLANELKNLFPDNTKIISQDEYCLDLKDPRHIWCDNVNHINFDVITSLDMGRMLEDLKNIIGTRNIPEIKQELNKQETYSGDYLLKTLENKIKSKNVLLVIMDGFLIYAYKPFLPLIQLKYFFVLDYQECFERRKKRVYDPPDVPNYFETCVWPEYLKHYTEVKNTLEDIIYFDSLMKNPLEMVLNDLLKFL